MKKIWIVIALLGMLFCGCGREKASGQVLEFWTISLKPTYTDYINRLISEFEAQNPGLKVEWIDVPINIMMQKLLASIAGGVPPDVVNLNTEYALLLAQNGALYDLDQVFPPREKAEFFPGLWQAAQWRGGVYAVPWYVSCQLIMYNRQLFREAGLPLKAPQNWEQVEACAVKIKEKTGEYGFMPAMKITDDWQIDGVKIIDFKTNRPAFNTPRAVNRLDWYINLKNRDLIPPETLTQGYQGALDRYQSGKLGMLIAGPQFLLKIKQNAPQVYQNTGLGLYPGGETGIIPAATMNLCVPRAGRKLNSAVKFIAFITSYQNQLDFCRLVPLLPTRRDVAADRFFKEGKGAPLEDEAIRLSLAQLARARDLSLGVKDSSRLMRILKEQIETAFYGKESPQQALEQAERDWERILQEQN